MSEVPRELRISVPLCPTALVKVFIDDVFVGLYRSLGDTGAQANLMANYLLKGGNYRTSPVHGELLGISRTPVRIRRKVTVGLLPWFVPNHEEKMIATFQLLPKSVPWAPIFPPCDVPSNELPGVLQKPLADPFFCAIDKSRYDFQC